MSAVTGVYVHHACAPHVLIVHPAFTSRCQASHRLRFDSTHCVHPVPLKDYSGVSYYLSMFQLHHYTSM